MARDQDRSPEQILALLRANPGAIAAAVLGLEDVQLDRIPSPGEWSAAAILAHLRACADVWGGACLAIVAQDHPTLRAVSPRSWIRRTSHAKQPFTSSFAAFRAQRGALLSVLDAQPAAAWGRSALVSGAGPATERTLASYAGQLAEHERAHVLQIGAVAAFLRA